MEVIGMIYCDRTDCVHNGESYEDNRICMNTDISIDSEGNCASYSDEE